MLPSPQNVTEYVWRAQRVGESRRRTNLRRRVTFLRELERSGSVVYASARADLDRRTLYRWRDADERFRARWDRALERREELLVDRGYALACAGNPRYFTRNGLPVSSYRRYDERLIMFMIGQLRARPSHARRPPDWVE